MNRETMRRLQQEHGEFVTQANAITELCEAEGRAPTEEERQKFRELLEFADERRAQADEVEDWIKSQERMAAQQAWRDEVQSVTLPEPVAANAPDPGRRGDSGPPTSTPEYAAAFGDWIKTGRRRPNLAAGFAQMDSDIQLAADDPMRTDVDSAGGYLIPDRLVDEIIQEKDRVFVGMMAARSQTIGFGESITYPYVTQRLGFAQRVGEAGGTPPNSRPNVQTFNLLPKMVWNETAATISMLMNRHFDVENYLKDELLYTLMYRCEEDIWTGDGDNSPLGVMTTSPAGIPAGRNRTLGTDATLVWKDIFDAKYSGLRPPYWPMAEWYVHPAQIGALRNLDNSDGSLVWQPAGQLGAPDRIDGVPVRVSEFIESNLDATTGTPIALLGDMSYYRRAEYPSIAIQRLVELDARQNQVIFLARKWDDGNPVHEQAFVRLVTA